MNQPMTYSAPSAPAPQPRRSSAGKIIGIIAAAVVVLGGIATAALFLFGHKTLDDGKLQDEIVRITQQASGLAPTDVHCPANVPIKAGDVTTCTAQLDGQQVSYTVHQNDDQGNVRIESTGFFLKVDSIEQELAQRVQQNTGTAVTAQCAPGKHVVVGGKGTTVPCTVTDKSDATNTAKYTATVTDDQGNIDFS